MSAVISHCDRCKLAILEGESYAVYGGNVLHSQAKCIERLQSQVDALRLWLESLRGRMEKAAEPWIGVRADIIPPSVQSIVVWYNEASSMLKQPDATPADAFNAALSQAPPFPLADPFGDGPRYRNDDMSPSATGEKS